MQANLGPLTDLIQRYRGGNHTYAVQVLMDLLNSYYEVEHYFATGNPLSLTLKISEHTSSIILCRCCLVHSQATGSGYQRATQGL